VPNRLRRMMNRTAGHGAPPSNLLTMPELKFGPTRATVATEKE
jgi:hypothetical protein